MKFGHEFQEALRKDDFPQHWVESAIAYGRLKRCIRRVQGELSALGLDAQTLKQLLETVENDASSTHAPFQYYFSNESAPHPRLVFIINAKDGIPISATLSPRTKDYLESLTLNLRTSQRRTMDAQNQPSGDDRTLCSHSNREGSDAEGSAESGSLSSNDSSSSAVSTSLEGVTDDSSTLLIEIPLTSDSEFFHLLKSEVSNLDALQAQEEVLATKEVVSLGNEISKVAAPSTSVAKSDIYRWREIIDLYARAEIFFSVSESDHGSRNSTVAQKQLKWFLAELERTKLLKQFKHKGSPVVLNQFMQINMELLRNLRFQEINRLAMTKILKKFDKRTALGAQKSFPGLVATGPFLVSTVARAVCFKLNEELLTIVPQLNDYLCPICFNISYKPVRLSCLHVFCIRCMITMQRAKEGHCPMCRSDVVLDADSTNLDSALMNFLKNYFPAEVKAKQRENEIAAYIDQYGTKVVECAVM